MDDLSRENSTSSRDKTTRRASSRNQEDEPRSVTLPRHPAAGRTPYTSAYNTSTPSQAGEQSASRTSYPISVSPFDSTMSRHASSGPTSVPTSKSQQYQLVSPGTPADPRAMSQVSPGFIFVIFPMFAMALLFIPCSFSFVSQISPLPPLKFLISYLMVWILDVFSRTPRMEYKSEANAFLQNNRDQLIQSLRTHRVNTITELRRIEKIFAYLDSAEVTEPMTTAWAHYVNSNNLLNELRGLTRTYPFSSECLDEAKAMVVRDPNSTRSWNYCWLVLVKMEKE